MKVFLGNIPWYTDKYLGVKAGSRWPHFYPKINSQNLVPAYLPFPFFLAYSASVVRELNDVEVLLIDGVAEGLETEEFILKIQDFCPDIVCFEISTPSINSDLKFCQKLKQANKNLKIILAGPHTPMYEENFLKENKSIDIIIMGEYEYILKDIAEGKDLKDITGIIFRDIHGKIKTTGQRPLKESLDDIPEPARDFLPMNNYRDLVCGIPEPSVQLWASRGCPFGCIFCSWPQVMYKGSKYRVRNPKLVVDELEAAIAKYGFESFYFDDDTFNIGEERIIELCNEIKSREIKLPWAVMARADTMTDNMLYALADAGLYAIKYGVESGDQNILDGSCKGLKLDKVKAVVKKTQDLGVKVHLTYTIGLPNEKEESVMKTIKLAKELNSDTAQFSIMTPFPGCKYFDMLDEKGYILSKNWDDFSGSTNSVMRTEYMDSNKIKSLHQQMKNMWHHHCFKRDREDFLINISRQLDENVTKSEVKKIFFMASSFKSHIDLALDYLQKKYLGAEITFLIQEQRYQDYEEKKINILVYKKEQFFKQDELFKQYPKLKHEDFDLAFMLYNRGPKKEYNEVENIINVLNANQKFGIDVCGCLINSKI